jgi:hypothetical protein
VTEATYTDEHITKERTGYLEICKRSAPPISPSDLVTFTLTSGQTVTVPADACSPAIEVLAGALTVHEAAFSQLGSAYFLQTCGAIPAANLAACSPGAGGGGSATVTIKSGTVSNETILNVCDVSDVAGTTASTPNICN